MCEDCTKEYFTENRTVIVGGRRSGKTIELVKMSAKTGIPIFTKYKQHARQMKEIALYLGLEIPEPVTGDCYGRKGVLVDEAQWLLEQQLGCKVYGLTVTGETVDLNKVEEETSANNNNDANITVNINCNEQKASEAYQKILDIFNEKLKYRKFDFYI